MSNPYEPPKSASGEAQQSPWSWIAAVAITFAALFAVVLAPLAIAGLLLWVFAPRS